MRDALLGENDVWQAGISRLERGAEFGLRGVNSPGKAPKQDSEGIVWRSFQGTASAGRGGELLFKHSSPVEGEYKRGRRNFSIECCEFPEGATIRGIWEVAELFLDRVLFGC